MAESPGLVPGLVLVAALVVLAVGFGIRQWLDRRCRPSDLAEADARYFARQDARRLAGSALMLLIAAAMTAGLAIDPRTDRRTGQLWGLLWLGVGVLVIALLVLGLVDWLDLRQYANRHRRALDAERRIVIQVESRKLDDAERRRESSHGDDPPTA